MVNLFAALRSSANAMEAFQRGLTVTQNNVANASTPGYARQTQSFEALGFDPIAGVPGGVVASRVESARNLYAEQSVRREAESLGKWQEKAEALAPLETGFDITGRGGIAGALSDLYASFSAWSVAPNDSAARQTILNRAGALSQVFQQTSNTLARSSQDADTRLRSLVDRVNELAGKLREFNIQRRGGELQDAGLEAGAYSALEQLSEIAGITVLKQDDGSLTVLMNGQTPLVVGEFQYRIGVSVAVPSAPPPLYPSGPPSAQILDASGRDISSEVTGGRLAGLLDFRNLTMAALRGDSSQPGGINRLAKAVADAVNQALVSGNISDGPPPVPGVPLFLYDATNGTNVAQTLTVDPNVTTGQLAAIAAGPPYQSNGIALRLASLASPQGAAGKIDNLSFTEFYGNLAARVGNDLSTARENHELQKNLLTQARTLRQQSSGVSLDAEAVHLLEFQRSYQAAAKLISVLDELTQIAVNLVR